MQSRIVGFELAVYVAHVFLLLGAVFYLAPEWLMTFIVKTKGWVFNFKLPFDDEVEFKEFSRSASKRLFLHALLFFVFAALAYIGRAAN